MWSGGESNLISKFVSFDHSWAPSVTDLAARGDCGATVPELHRYLFVFASLLDENQIGLMPDLHIVNSSRVFARTLGQRTSKQPKSLF